MEIIMNKKRFFYNGIMLTAVGLLMRTVGLLFNAFITRAVGAEGIGLYTVVMTVYGFAVTFATSGISLTVTRLVASAIGEGRDDEVNKILVGAVIYALGFGMTATAVLFFGASSFASFVLGDMRAASSLRILAPSLLPLSLVSVFSGYFVGIRRVSSNAIVQILGQGFKICATVWLVLRGSELGVEGASRALSIGTTATEIICFILIFIRFIIDRRGKENAKGASVRAVADVAVPLAISAYIRQALLTLEHILIPKRLEHRGDSTAEALSAYGILHGMALPMVLYPMTTLSSFSGLLVPEFAEHSASGDGAAMRRMATRAFETTLIYAAAVATLLFMFSEELGFVVYGSREAGHFIAVLAPVVPIMYLDHVTDNVLKGIGEQVYSMWVNITDSIISIVLVFFLIPKLGILGYAVCIIVMEAYNFILSIIRLRSRIKFSIRVSSTIIYPVIASVISAVITKRAFISAGAQSKGLWTVLEILFSVCILVAAYKIIAMIDSGIRKKLCLRKQKRLS